MPVNLTDSATWETNVVAPADGDSANGATFQAGLQDCANRTAYLRAQTLVGSAASDVPIPLSPGEVDEGAAERWTAVDGGKLEQNSTARPTARVRLPHFPGGEISGIKVQLHGDFDGAGPHAGLPATMPAVTVYKKVISTGVVTTLGTTTDSSASVGAYEAAHEVAVAFTAEAFDGDTEFEVKIEGEASTNALANALQVLGLKATIGPA